MNTLLWVLQVFIALTFLYSGICKIYFSEQKLIAMGQTGIVGLPIAFIRFIGVSELLGAIGITLPLWLNLYPILTPISAFSFAFIMPFAAIAHYRLKEYKQIAFNLLLMCVCLFIGVARWI